MRGLGLFLGFTRRIVAAIIDALYEDAYYTNDSATDRYFTNDAKTDRYYTK